MQNRSIAIFCVGNKLMLDDGVGSVVFEELTQRYSFEPHVSIFDVGCLSMDMIHYVDDYDYIVTVDAVDGTGEPAGTVFEFSPEDMARRDVASASLHELRLADLFDASSLLGYESEGICFGIQAENRSPATVTIGLTLPVAQKVPLLIESILANLVKNGVKVVYEPTGEEVKPGWSHPLN